MSQPQIELAFKGLYTSVNDLSSAPEGSLLEADNILIESTNLAKPRMGFDDYPTRYGLSTDRADAMFFFKGKTFVHYGVKLAYSSGAAFTAYAANISAPTGFKITSAQSNKNLYFTSSAGVKKIDDETLEPKVVGVPKAIHLSTSNNAAASGFLTNNYSVNYRVCWGYRDANNNVIIGAPSALFTHSNASGTTKNVDLQSFIPAGISTSHFAQIYRSYAATGAGVFPSNQLYQAAEYSPTSTDITNGYFNYTDIIPEALLGQDLYTNASILQANDQPPLAKVICRFKDQMFYGNTISKHRYSFRLLGTSIMSAAVPDTLTIAGQVYTAGAVTNTATRVFAAYGAISGAASTGSASEDVRQTALAICRCINENASSTVYGFYLNDTSQATQGEILVEERAIGGSSFTVLVSRPTSFSPSTLGTAQTSRNEEAVNQICYSKVQQPEAVPLISTLVIGSSDKAILAMLSLRESLIVLKEDGTYRISSTLGVELLDGTQALIGPATAVALSNAVYALTTQGIVNITDGGVQVIDLPIAGDIRRLFGSSLETIKANAFAIAYETRRLYILFLPSGPLDPYCSQAYVFNTFTQTWVRWPMQRTCGILNPTTDRLILGPTKRNGLDVERKTFDFSDNVDFDSYQTISLVVGTRITITSPDLLAQGDLVYQDSSTYSYVVSVDIAAGTVVMLDALAWNTAVTVSIFKAIKTKITWVPVTGGNPAALKHFSECVFYFKQNFPGTALASFSSDKASGIKSVTLTGDSPSGGWGLFAWGEEPWGSIASKRPVRILVPREQQRCSQLTITFEHAYAFAGWELSGISILYNPGSNRV